MQQSRMLTQYRVASLIFFAFHLGCSPTGASDGASDPASGGGGDPGTENGDCRAADRSCYAPYECTLDLDPDKQMQTYACRSKQRGIPTCKGAPAGQVVSFHTVRDTGITTHWTNDGGCIPITYDPAMSGKRKEIIDAWHAISNVAGVSYCFLQPNESAPRPDMARLERRIHIRPAVDPTELTLGTGHNFSITHILFEKTTGRISNAEIIYANNEIAIRTSASFLHHLAIALGLQSEGSDNFKTSIVYQFIHPTDSNPDAPLPSTPSAIDIIALQKLYGTPPFCEEPTSSTMPI